MDRLSTLPAEIRLMIFSYCLPQHELTVHSPSSPQPPFVLNLALVNKCISREAIEFLFRNAEFNIYPQRGMMRGLWSTPHDAQGDHHRDPEEMLRVALDNFRHLTIIPASRNPFTESRSRRSHLSACTTASMVKETISRRRETHHRGDYAQMRIVVSFHVNDFFAPPVADWGAAQSIIAPVQIMGLESPSFDILRNYFADTNGQSPWMAHIRTRVPHVPVSSAADQLQVNRDYLARLEQLFASATESLGLSELNYKFIKVGHWPE